MFSWLWLTLLWGKEAVMGFFRNFRWNAVTLMLCVLCLVCFAGSYIFGQNAEYFAAELGTEKVEIKVELTKGISAEERAAAEQAVLAMPHVKDVEVVTEEEAYQEMEQEMGAVLGALEQNPFLAQLIIKLEEPSRVQAVAAELATMPNVESVAYGKGYVEKFLWLTDMIQKAGYGVTVLVGALAAYIISTMIKLNIAQRKEEIHIKRMTGSGMLTIRVPFILEALLITLASGALVYALFWLGYDAAAWQIHTRLPYVELLSGEELEKGLVYALLASSLAVGLGGSLFAAKRNAKRY